MKALSIIQPWAWWVFHGKDVENRQWRASYRGPLLIHASKKWDANGADWIQRMIEKGKIFYVGPPVDSTDSRIIYGAIIGAVDLVKCVRQDSSPWFFGPWGLLFKNPTELRNPIPWRGQLGIFDIPNVIVDRHLNPPKERFAFIND